MFERGIGANDYYTKKKITLIFQIIKNQKQLLVPEGH